MHFIKSLTEIAKIMKNYKKSKFVFISIVSLFLIFCACNKNEMGNKKLKASFTVEAETGDSPWKVKFTNTSSEESISFHWDFGDGTMSNERSPEHVYSNIYTSHSKTFLVKLYVHDNEMNVDSFQKELTVNKLVIPPLQFNSDLNYGTVSDCDGNTYKTINIGYQTWMAENLRTTKYNTGTSLEWITSQSELEGLTEGAYAYYNYDLGYSHVYGALYNITAIESGVCPEGWHVPSQNEWSVLITSLGGGNIAGSAMKEVGTSHWLEPNSDATNQSGFTSIGSGTFSGGSYSINEANAFWSSTRQSQTYTYFAGQRYDTTIFDIGSRYAFGIFMSVRCVKNL